MNHPLGVAFLEKLGDLLESDPVRPHVFDAPSSRGAVVDTFLQGMIAVLVWFGEPLGHVAGAGSYGDEVLLPEDLKDVFGRKRIVWQSPWISEDRRECES